MQGSEASLLSPPMWDPQGGSSLQAESHSGHFTAAPDGTRGASGSHCLLVCTTGSFQSLTGPQGLSQVLHSRVHRKGVLWRGWLPHGC